MKNIQGSIYKRFFKRPLDIILSLIAIIVLSPIFVIVAVLVRTKLGSPIFFKQQRPGLNEEIFMMYKFRTMTDEKDKEGNLLPDSERLTNFGKLLRSTSLDELPGLLNVLKGDMSVIGPRPLLVRYLDYYHTSEKARHHVRPGLSGLAQVNGRNSLDWDKRLALDIEYVENISLMLDIQIILKTILKVIKKEGIVVVDQADLRDLDVERKK